MCATTAEKHEFQAEARQLLDLMIHSVYSNRDIFLRELISNASDAIDKLRVEALADSSLPQPADPHIRIEADEAARTITIHDTGIGMSREEVRQYIGTIARSGTQQFLRQWKELKKDTLTPELIGQFGVGFYSSFMVADRVTLVTRRAGEEGATRWESEGDGTYTLEDAERDACGTTIALHLKKEDGDEDEILEYTKSWKIRQIVKKYSDFVTWPIRMKVERTEYERDERGKIKEGGKETKVVEDQTLNSMKAIWTRPASEVGEDELKEFYKHVSHDWSDPLETIRLKAEGTLEFHALLFVPSKAPFDLYYREAKRGIHLYVKRIFIMDDCEELMPHYLRFIRGVVDSEDLSLNISREILQQNRQIRVMRKRLVKKVIETLDEMREKRPEDYGKFWGEFGRVLKEGLFEDAENRDRLLPLCRFDSTHSAEEKTSLDDYIARMKPGQEKIFFLTGESRVVVENSPHLEAYREKGIEVLILSDPVDEVWTQSVFEYDGKTFESIGKGAAELGEEEGREKAEAELKARQEEVGDLLAALQKALEADIKEVRLTRRLTQSPACLVGETTDMTPQMEQMLKAMNQEVPVNKRILELNPNHEILKKLEAAFAKDRSDPRIGEYAQLLHGQALLAEGSAVKDPAKLGRLLADLMVRSL